MAKQYWRPGTMLYPIPAVMVSCQREGERPNIITIAWAGTVNTDPAMVSISIRHERYSYDIIRETGEFVINLVTADLTYATDFCGVRSGRKVDKFKEMGLTELKSKFVSAPGIAESPLNIECKVKQIIPLGTHDMFVAEVMGVTTDDKYLDEHGKFHLNHAGLVTYSHGEYFELGKKIGKFGYSVEKPEKKSGETSGKAGKKNSETSGKAGKKNSETPGKPEKKSGETSGKAEKKNSETFGKPEKKSGETFRKAGKKSGDSIGKTGRKVNGKANVKTKADTGTEKKSARGVSRAKSSKKTSK